MLGAQAHRVLVAREVRRLRAPIRETRLVRKLPLLRPEPINWPRADPADLARFDPRSKACTMNCGPARGDPRSDAERKLLCDDCIPVMERT